MYKFIEENELKILDNKDIQGISCDDVLLEEFDEIKKLGEAMIKYCAENNGLGMAAPQVGVNLNMFVFMNGENSFQVILNPRLFPNGKVTNVVESCLSSPGEHYFLKRNKEVRMKFYFVKDGKMMSHSKNFSGERAFIVQHEYDHLIGETIVSKGMLFSTDDKDDKDDNENNNA